MSLVFETSLLRVAATLVFSNSTVPLSFPSVRSHLVTKKQKVAVAQAAADRGACAQPDPHAQCLTPRPDSFVGSRHTPAGAVIAAMSGGDVGDPDADAADMDTLRILTATSAPAVGSAGNAYLRYADKLVKNGYLKVTHVEVTHNLALGFMKHALSEPDTVDEETGEIKKGRIGYHVQTTAHDLVSHFAYFCAVVGWILPAATVSAMNNAICAHALSVQCALVNRTQPVIRSHLDAALERLGAGAPGWKNLTGPIDLSLISSTAALQIDAALSTGIESGRRQGSNETLRVGDVFAKFFPSLPGWTVTFGFDYDKVFASSQQAVPIVNQSGARALVTLLTASNCFEHSGADVEVCSALRVAARPLSLLRRIGLHGVLTAELLGVEGGSAAVVLTLGASGRKVTGKALRCGMVTSDMLDQVVAEGPNSVTSLISPHSSIKAGWSTTDGCQMVAYTRAVAVQAVAFTAPFPGPSVEHRAKRKAVLAELVETLVPLDLAFDAAAAPCGAEALRTYAYSRYRKETAQKMCSGLLACPHGASVPPFALPFVLTEDVMRLQHRLFVLKEQYKLPLATSRRYATRLAALTKVQQQRITALASELDSLLATCIQHAPATAADACAEAMSRPARTRHIDFQALKGHSKYCYTMEQLASLSQQEIDVLLSDDTVSYECPLLRRQSS